MTRGALPHQKSQSKKTNQIVRKQHKGPWLTASQVAEYLALSSHRAVRELERRGVLPGHRLGGSVRFSLPELDALLIRSRQATVDEMIEEETPIVIPRSEPLGPLMTPEEAAEYLGLTTVEAVNMRAYRGQVPVYRIGERILRYHREELDAALLGKPLTSTEMQSSMDFDARLQEGKGGG